MRTCLISAFISIFLCACVGPTSPFGALEEVKKTKLPKDSDDEREVASQKQNYQISFHPKRQVFHDKADVSIELKSDYPIADNIRLQVVHNGLDVTQAFINSSSIHRSEDQKTRVYLLENFRLKTLDANKIQVYVLKDGKKVLDSKPLKAPDCSLFQKGQLAHLGTFRAPAEYIPLIEKIATNHNANPSLLAGIVAQESGFDPQAVSWAKAIGLTQITPLAEKEVLDVLGNWPQYPGINSLSYVTLKAKIHLGEITQGEEWRLDPEKSLEGGITYIGYLKRYWNLNENKKLVESLDGEFETNLTELVLASYNSGAARVKRAVKLLKNDWKKHKKLSEAVNYLKKVNSYCFHYTEPISEVNDDNET